MYGRKAMANNFDLTPGKLRRQLFDILDNFPLPGDGKVARAIPIAFPVTEVVWALEETVEEMAGFLQRSMLEALRRFGPATADELNELLALGPDIIGNTLMELQSKGAPLSQKSGRFRLDEPTGPEDDLDTFRVTVQQKRVFLVNSIVDKLLPHDLWDSHNEYRLRPDAETGKILDRYGNPSAVFIYLMPAFHNGKNDLEKHIRQHDIQKMEMVGIPEGARELTENRPQHFETSWVLSFLILMHNRSIIAVSGGDVPCKLDIPQADTRGYLAQACIGLRSGMLSSDVSLEQIQQSIPKLPEGTLQGSQPNEFYVPLENPEKELTVEAVWGSDDEEDGAKSQVVIGLVKGYLWHRATRALIRFLPGDTRTAERVCLLRGCAQMRRFLRGFQHGQALETRADISEWWDGFQKDFAQSLPDALTLSTVPVDRLIETAFSLTDAEFVEKLEMVLESPRRVEAGEMVKKKDADWKILANIDGAARLGDAITGIIESAEKELDIISPVIDDEHLINAVNEARGRGVNVRIISELLDKDKRGDVITRFPTRGLDMEKKELKKHHSAMRSLGCSGALCRTSSYYPHVKMVLKDREVGIISSVNLTINSLGRAGDSSIEAGVLTDRGDVVNGALSFFNGLWEGCPFRQYREGNEVYIVEQRARPMTSELLEQHWGGLSLAATYPPDRRYLRDRIVNLIEGASESVKLVCMSFYEAHLIKPLHSSLIKALDRGVSAEVFMRRQFAEHYSDEWPDKGTAELMEHGLIVKLVENLHAKGILVDDRHCGIFSANLNPFSLESKVASAHIELGLFWDGDEAAAEGWKEFVKNVNKISSSYKRPKRSKNVF